MKEIRRLEREHVSEMSRLMMNAYPGFDVSPNARQNTREWVAKMISGGGGEYGLGCFQEEQLVGGMHVLRQPLNMRMKQVEAIGLGGLCVDLMHKKQKVAFQLLTHAFEEGSRQGAVMALLDPFNIGFYKKMGCGMGVRKHQYQLKPCQFPGSGDASIVKEIHSSQFSDVMDYLHGFFEQNHGMLHITEHEVRDILKDYQLTVGVWTQGKLSGLMPLKFERTAPKNLFKNHMIVDMVLYNNPETLKAFWSFIKSQDDQVAQVILTTQESDFDLNFDDPDTGDDQTFHTRSNEMYRTGNGMMMRILNVEKALNTVNVPDHLTHHLPMTVGINDSLLEGNAGLWHLAVAEGSLKASPGGTSGTVDGTIDIGDLSSLLMGAGHMESLLRYGRVKTNNEKKWRAFGQALSYKVAPRCLSRF